MDFGGALQRAWRMLQLDTEAMREVAADGNALLPGLLILVIAGVLSGVGSAIVSGGLGALAIPMNIVIVPVVALILAGIYHLLALLFGGRGTFMPLFNTLNHGSGLANWLGVVPFVGSLIGGVWGLVVSIVVVREIHGLSTGKAVLVILIPIFVLLSCCVLVSILFGATVLSLIMANQS